MSSMLLATSGSGRTAGAGDCGGMAARTGGGIELNEAAEIATVAAAATAAITLTGLTTVSATEEFKLAALLWVLRTLAGSVEAAATLTGGGDETSTVGKMFINALLLVFSAGETTADAGDSTAGSCGTSQHLPAISAAADKKAKSSPSVGLRS